MSLYLSIRVEMPSATDESVTQTQDPDDSWQLTRLSRVLIGIILIATVFGLGQGLTTNEPGPVPVPEVANSAAKTDSTGAADMAQPALSQLNNAAASATTTTAKMNTLPVLSTRTTSNNDETLSTPAVETVTIADADVPPKRPLEKETKPAPPAHTAAGDDAIKRAQFALGVSDREPQSVAIEQVALAPGNALYFFTELNNYPGSQLHHQWYFNDTLMADIPLTVNGQRWRTYSRKTIPVGWFGNWRVDIRQADGKLLSQHRIKVVSTPDPHA